ncbi:MAG: DUF4290 domain-containing protein [Muribaculaceae bacterium]|nr:DUF4290 domain-containing protein [Muribaculaceae bacterium]MDE5929846.1 DUF4290 domain-containing protein [Muribaculaceae bacterium]
MLTYTTHLKKLILPEYGRNIQRMVDHCLTIEDRQERTDCAMAIHKAMLTLFPSQENQDNYRRKLWDHLALMSDFRLDIDWPVEISPRPEKDAGPDKLPYPGHTDRWRQYGSAIRMTIDTILAMPEGDERDTLTMLLANQMKKICLENNPDGIDDEKVFKDLYYMSDGKIEIFPEQLKLYEYKIAPVPGKKKKKK